jgi:hypothetical protein
MKMSKNLGAILLAIWLILFGVLHNSFFSINFSHAGDVLAVLGIAAGILLLLNRS